VHVQLDGDLLAEADQDQVDVLEDRPIHVADGDVVQDDALGSGTGVAVEFGAREEGVDVADLRWQAGLFAGMGMSYSMLQDFEAAVTYLRKSEALFEAINNKTRAVESRLRAAMSLPRIE